MRKTFVWLGVSLAIAGCKGEPEDTDVELPVDTDVEQPVDADGDGVTADLDCDDVWRRDRDFVHCLSCGRDDPMPSGQRAQCYGCAKHPKR